MSLPRKYSFHANNAASERVNASWTPNLIGIKSVLAKTTDTNCMTRDRERERGKTSVDARLTHETCVCWLESSSLSAAGYTYILDKTDWLPLDGRERKSQEPETADPDREPVNKYSLWLEILTWNCMNFAERLRFKPLLVGIFDWTHLQTNSSLLAVHTFPMVIS